MTACSVPVCNTTMADLPVDSIELESNANPGEDDNSTLSGNTGYKKVVVIIPSDTKTVYQNQKKT